MSIDQLMADAGLSEVGEGVWVHLERVAADHPRRGTCVPGCPEYGFCHAPCTCGQRTAINTVHRPNAGYVGGRPSTFRPGHNPRRLRGCWTVNGVPIEKVRPLARWLIGKYGWNNVPDFSSGHLASLLSPTRDRSRVSPETARRLTELVLAHRRPADPWRFTPEEERRVLPSHVREHMEDVVRRERMRRDTNARRKKLREARSA